MTLMALMTFVSLVSEHENYESSFVYRSDVDARKKKKKRWEKKLAAQRV